MRSSSARQQDLLDGVRWNVLAEALAVPMGLATAAFLGRILGPSAYGLFALAASFVSVLEWMLAALFSRAVVKLTAERGEWHPIAATAMRLHLAIGAGMGGLVAIAATPLAAWLGEPSLASYLRLFAVELPLFGLFAAGRNIQAGRGLYRLRAIGSAVRWSARLVLVVVFVGAGLSIPGAIAGSIGAVLLGGAVAHAGLRLAWWRSPGGAGRELWRLALPLFALALSLRVFEKLGLFVLKAIGATAAEAGLYAAAQNLAAAPMLVAQAATPLLLSGLTLAMNDRRPDGARHLAAASLRLTLWLTPFVAFVAGAADEVMTFVYGSSFALGGPVAAMLMLSSVGTSVLAVTTSQLIAANRGGLALWVSAPLSAAALPGIGLLVPELGGAGAALVTMLVASAGALAAVFATMKTWKFRVDPTTLITTTTAGLASYAFAAAWETEGGMLLVKSGIACVAIAALMLIRGELRQVSARDHFQRGGR